MNIILYASLVMFLYMTAWYVLSLFLKRGDIADIAWGLGFIMLTWILYNHAATNSLAFYIASLLITLWGLRLAAHIFMRARGKKEDKRYAAWRKEWGATFWWRSYLQVFLLQGTLLMIVLAPVFAMSESLASAPGREWLLPVGVVLWIVGFFFEAVSDMQLVLFKRDKKNKGKILDTGLWRYSRHPNYFGELLMWWSIGLIACTHIGAWVGLVGPLVITLLILFVSGVPMLESHYKGNKAYDRYKKKTSVLIPWPPKA